MTYACGICADKRGRGGAARQGRPLSERGNMAKAISVGAAAKAAAFAKYGTGALSGLKAGDGALDYVKMPDNTEAQQKARADAKKKHDAWVFGLPNMPAEDVTVWTAARTALVNGAGAVTLRNAALYLGVQDAQVRSWASVNGFSVKDGMISGADVKEIERRRTALVEYVVSYDIINGDNGDTSDKAARINRKSYDDILAGFELAGFVPGADVIAKLKEKYGITD